MFGPLLSFELRSHFRRPVTWLYVAIVFLLAFFSVSTDAVLVGQTLGKVKKNSPYALAQLYAIILALGQIITSALVGTTVLRDFETITLWGCSPLRATTVATFAEGRGAGP